MQRRPSIVLSMRRVEKGTNDRGEETTRVDAGGGVVVVVRPDSLSRRKFRQFCQRRRLIAWAAERGGNSDGRYNRRDGVDEVAFRELVESARAYYGGTDAGTGDYREDADVSAWNVIGPGEALAELVGMDDSGRRSDPKPFVLSWQYAMNAALPRAAQGSGPEKVRPCPAKPAKEKPGNPHDYRMRGEIYPHADTPREGPAR